MLTARLSRQKLVVADEPSTLHIITFFLQLSHNRHIKLKSQTINYQRFNFLQIHFFTLSVT